MGAVFWIRRFTLVACVAFLAIAGAQLLRGRPLEVALMHALAWSVVAAGIFTGARIYQSRRGQRCALCNDMPIRAPSDGGGAA